METHIYDFIDTVLSPGNTILELGSGESTSIFVKKYKVYSIEDDEEYLYIEPLAQYIYASSTKYSITNFPQESVWYNVDTLSRAIKHITYDMIIVDGPLGKKGRGGFYEFLSLFNTDAHMLFHDTQRSSVRTLARLVAKKIQRKFITHGAPRQGISNYPFFGFIDKK